MATTMAMPTSMPSVTTNNFGRDKVPWSKEVWDRIDKAVNDEMMRTRVGQKFLPIRPVLPRTTSVPSDIITPIQDPNTETFTETVDEGNTTRLNEFWVEFSMTPQQIEQETGDPSEMGHSTAVTLATRAANILAQAEDLVIFQGQNAIESTDPNSLFKTTVRHRGEPDDTGLLDLTIPGQTNPPLLPPVQVEKVQPLDPDTPGILRREQLRRRC